MKRSNDPHVALAEAISGLRVLGFVFVSVWSLIAFIATDRGQSIPRTNPELTLFISGTALLLAPGSIYFVAAVLVKRREEKAARLAQRTAIAQIVIVPIGILLAVLSSSRKLGSLTTAPAAGPAIVTAFFVPALLAQCFAIAKARRAIAMLPGGRVGFEAIPLATLAEPDLQPSETDREK